MGRVSAWNSFGFFNTVNEPNAEKTKIAKDDKLEETVVVDQETVVESEQTKKSSRKKAVKAEPTEEA